MKALVVVDMQRDFMPGGPLAVEGADQLVGKINRLIDAFPLVIATQDWHPMGHSSFVTDWPKHCIQGSEGAEFAQGLVVEGFDHITRKGSDPDVDSYSAFFDNERRRQTDLDAFLKERGVKALYFVGVATDYCVLYSVLDALDLGYEVFVIEEGCKAIGDEKDAFATMQSKGAKLIRLEEAL